MAYSLMRLLPTLSKKIKSFSISSFKLELQQETTFGKVYILMNFNYISRRDEKNNYFYLHLISIFSAICY